MFSGTRTPHRVWSNEFIRMNKFREQVFEIVKKVPKGKVITYGQIAMMLGKPRGAREVGWMLHSNNNSDVPCHRVVDRNGRLAPNFAFEGAVEQKGRLEAEGVKFVDEMHVDLKTSIL